MRDETQKITRHEPGVTGGRETVTILNGARFRDCGISPKIVVSCGIEIAYIGTCILSFLIKKKRQFANTQTRVRFQLAVVWIKVGTKSKKRQISLTILKNICALL